MPRVVFRLWLRPDPVAIETYAQGHLHPFPELYDLIRRSGIKNYTIWLDGPDLLLTREGDTPLKGEELDLTNPVHKAWSDTMTPLFDARTKNGAGMPDEIFSLDPDRPQGPMQMVYRAGLRPGTEPEVTRLHREAPEAVRAAMRKAGVLREWSWIEPGDLWTFRESADLAATEAALAASPAYSAW